MLGGLREEGPSLNTVFADYLTHADLTKYAVINPNSRKISISSANFAALNKKKNAEDTTVNPVNPVDSTVASKVSEKTKPVVSKVVTTPNGKVFFVSISNFNHQFNHYYAQTPSQYRKTNCNKKTNKS